VTKGAGLERDRDFGEYVATHAATLRRTAYLLCADWHRAEDLVQTTLAKIYVVWPRVHREGQIDAYIRKTLVRTMIDESRSAFRRRERVVGELPEHAAREVGVDDRLAVRDALAQLPPRQRAVLVLRFWEDLPVEATAAALGCTTGTVKSQTAKALANLRGPLAAAGMEITEVMG